MLLSISLFGVKIYNYAIFIILLTVSVKIVRTLLTFIGTKQSRAREKAEKKIKEFKQESGEDRKLLADKIYKYYTTSNYNPFVYYFVKVFVFVLDFVIISAMVATFKPITNFHIINNDVASSVVSLYKESSPDAKRYTEIRLLNDLEKYEDEFKKAGATDEEIKTLYELRESFCLGNLKTYIVPSMSTFSKDMLLPITAFALFFISTMITVVTQLKSLIKRFKDMVITQKMMSIVSLALSLLCLVLVSTFIFNTPMIIGFYFIINYSWGLITKIFHLTKKKKLN